MVSKSLVSKLYKFFSNKNKNKEKLEIGKIQFEVKAILINNKPVYSTFQLKTKSTNNELNKNFYVIRYFLYFSILFICGFELYNLFHFFFMNMGIIQTSSLLVSQEITPFIFYGFDSI